MYKTLSQVKKFSPSANKFNFNSEVSSACSSGHMDHECNHDCHFNYDSEDTETNNLVGQALMHCEATRGGKRRHSTMLKREFNSDKLTKWRRRLSSAETSRCTEPADTVTPAHMPTDLTNSKRRHIFHQTSWLNYVYNSTSKVRVLTEKDANISTQFMTLKLNLHTPKHLRKELDSLTWETSRSAVKASPVPTAFGPTWKPQMDVVLQRSQDLQSSSKSTTRMNTTQKSTMRTTWREPTHSTQWADQTVRTSDTNHNKLNQCQNPWTIIITTTNSPIIIITWDTRAITCRTTTSSSNSNQCIIIIINRLITTRTIIIIVADNKLTQLHHLPIKSTRTSSRSGPESDWVYVTICDFLLSYRLI